jgi:hypothetical protein
MAKKEKPPIENRIYQSIILYCEELENEKIYRGNGHHLAQKLTTLVSAGLLSRQEKKVFDCLSQTKKKTIEIAREIKLPSKTVSAILGQIRKKSLLIHCTMENKKNKLWYK